MTDPRFQKLAAILTGYSTRLQKGERVLIEAHDIPDEMVVELVRATRSRGAIPYVQINHARVQRELFLNSTSKQIEYLAKVELQRMKGMQAYISLRGSKNIFEMSDVPAKDMKTALGIMRPVLDWRVKKTKWVVLRWPSPSMAQQAMMSSEVFENFYFDVCTLDYAKMGRASKALKNLMDRTDQVHIKGPGTDLKFSIKGIGSVICSGLRNIPDGEVFSCPIKNSVEGELTYTAPTIYQGVSFENVRLKFKKGKIVEATSNNTKRLNEILDTDSGSRYIGEFSLGFNPHILHPMRDILFDEKIAGSFHFTPGQAYESADNGNKSSVHWDMVCIQRKEYGGGEIYFDGKLIRKDGLFVPKSLIPLNPKELLKKKKG